MKRFVLLLLLALTHTPMHAVQAGLCPPQEADPNGSEYNWGECFFDPDTGKMWIRLYKDLAAGVLGQNHCRINCTGWSLPITNPNQIAIYVGVGKASPPNFNPGTDFTPNPPFNMAVEASHYNQDNGDLCSVPNNHYVAFYAIGSSPNSSVMTQIGAWLADDSKEFIELFVGTFNVPVTFDAGVDCGNPTGNNCSAVRLLLSQGYLQTRWVLEYDLSSDFVPMTAPVVTASLNNCVWCHRHQPYPADINMTGADKIRKHQLPLIWRGVEERLAPFIEVMTPTNVNVFRTWVSASGFNVPRTFRATNFGWLQEQFIGTNGQPPAGWYFTLEDGWIDGKFANGGNIGHRWRVLHTKSDSRGVSRDRVLWLRQNRTTNADSFATSPVSNVYGWLGRFQRYRGDFYDYSIEYDVLGYDNGRHVGMTFLVEDLEPNGRTKRRYIKFIVDADGYFIRSAPMNGEKHPFGADGRLVGKLSQIGNVPDGDEWLHVKIDTKRINSKNRIAPTDTMGTIIRASVTKVWNQQQVADLYAVAVNDTLLRGSWGVAKYDTGNVFWANIRVFAKVDTIGQGAPPNPTPSQRRQPTTEIRDPGDGDDTDYPGSPTPDLSDAGLDVQEMGVASSKHSMWEVVQELLEGTHEH